MILLLLLAGVIPVEWGQVDVEGYVLEWGIEGAVLAPETTQYTVTGLDHCEEHELSILAYRGLMNSEKVYIRGMPSVKLRRVRVVGRVYVGPRSRLVTFRGKNFAPGVKIEFPVPGVSVTVQSSTCTEIVALLQLDDSVQRMRRYRVSNPDGTYADGWMRFGIRARRWQ